MERRTSFDLPVCLTVEEDALLHTDEIIRTYLPEIYGKKTLVVSEPNLIDLYDDVVNEISRDMGGAEVYAIKNASFDEAVDIARKICIEDIQIIVGFGGGRVLDTAKYAAHISKATYICLPSSLSNDSLASPFAVLETENGARKTLSCLIPEAIIVDTTLIAKAPLNQILSGIGDTIAKHTALYDWKISAKKSGQAINDFAYALSRMSYDSVYHCDQKDLKSRVFIRILSRALVMGGLAMEIAGSSRPCSGSEHLFAHAIEEYYPEIRISHGFSVALGSVASCIFQGQDEKGISEFYRTYGIDTDPSVYGISKEMFADIWMKARTVRPGRITVLDETPWDRKQLDEIYSRMVEK